MQAVTKPTAAPDPAPQNHVTPAQAAAMPTDPASAVVALPPPSATHVKPDAPPATPSPAAQVAPALVSLAHAPNGTSRLTLRLDPPDLGHVEVRVTRLPGEPVRVEVTVQRPETLGLLLRDQPQLQRALDQAGLPADGRSLTFHVAAPPPPASPSASAPTGPSGFAPSGDDYGSPGNHHQGGAGRGGMPAEDASADAGPAPSPVWLRAGLDITA